MLSSTGVSAQAIYRAWADWTLLGDNMKYPPAFGSAGGDDLGSGLSIPPYYFLENGWRVRPMEASQNLTITGNLFVRGGGIPVVPTLGVFQVTVNYTVPVQAQGISTSGSTGPTAAQIAAEIALLGGSGGTGGLTPTQAAQLAALAALLPQVKQDTGLIPALI